MVSPPPKSTINSTGPPGPPGPPGRTRPASYVPYAAFTAFGIFWGTWGAALPAIRSHTGLSEGQLGTALLFVGLGALPAMLLTGRALDRFGPRLAAPLLAALGLAGLVVVMGARGMSSLVVGMLLVGALSGAADVAINTVSGQVEHDTARPVLTRAHGVFSLAVVAASLTSGLVLSSGSAAASGAGAGSAGALGWAFAVAGAAVAVLSLLVWAGTTARPTRATSPVRAVEEQAAMRTASQASQASPATLPTPAPGPALLTAPLVAVGLVGALAYATENAHQSWGAVFLTDTFTASAQTASWAPAVFAAAAAAARLTLAPLSRTRPRVLLVTGGAVACAGSLVLATSTTVAIALLGLGIAALGTATLFPTLLSTSLRDVAPGRRGRATSVISTTAYLGFLLGPAYVGLLAEQVGLRGAVVGIAALAVVFTVTGGPISRWAAGKADTSP